MKNLEELLSRLTREEAETEAYLKGLRVSIDLTKQKMANVQTEQELETAPSKKEFKL